jgi:hypothetical protein
MVFGNLPGVNFLSGSSDISRIKETENSNKAEKQKAASSALRQWWLELQDTMGKENKKDVAADGKATLTSATDSLQPLLDIIFFRYWDIEQERAEGERLISGEVMHRFLNDLLRENEGAAVEALKDYVKYSMAAGTGDNEAAKAKKDEFIEEKKKAAFAKFDLQLAMETSTLDTVDEVETKVNEAKEAGVDTTDAEKELTRLKEKKEKKDAAQKELDEAMGAASVDTLGDLQKKMSAAKTAGCNVLEAMSKIADLDDEKKGKTEEHKAKREKAATDRKENQDRLDKLAEDKNKELKDKAETNRTTLEADTVKAAEVEFAVMWKEAVNGIVDEMASSYKEGPFSNRQAAAAKFQELDLADKEKLTQNELNKIFNLGDPSRFNQLCESYGFKADSYDKALEKMGGGEKSEKKEE